MTTVRAALWLGAVLAAPLVADARELLEPLTARVLYPPASVRGDDERTRLTYELQVTNLLPRPLAMTSVEVRDAAGRLQLIERDDLARRFRPFGVAREELDKWSQADHLTLAPGMSGLIYLRITVPEPDGISGQLRHSISVESGTDDGKEARTIELLPVELPSRQPIGIGPPVRGGPWLASNGPSNTSGHRRLPIPLHGRLAIFQRYAIDYIKLDSRGRWLSGDWRDNRSHFTHREEAIAVADAVVVSVVDDIAENVPDELPTGDALSLDTVYGNAVVLDIGDGHYAIYAHLLPGTLTVKPQDRVSRGDVLGLIGNTGNSLRPHLHFQLADSMLPLSGEGLPYVHERFDWAGTCPGRPDLQAPPCELGRREFRTNAIPLDASIVFFPRL